MRSVLALVVLFCVTSSLMARPDDPIKELIDTSEAEVAPTPAVPEDIRALIRAAEASEATAPPPDARARFCKNSRGIFYHPAECRRKNLEPTYCQYGGCGKDLCFDPPTSCAQRHAKANDINTSGNGGTTPPPQTGTEDEVETKNYYSIPGACGSNIYIQNPISGYRANSAFGYRKDPFTGRRKFHSGSDFKAPSGRPIRAAAAGTMKCPIGSGYGRGIEINHGKGLTTRYAHMTRYRNSAGQKSTSTKSCNGRKVQRGDIIGYVGSTGRSTGPHLHFEIRCNNKAVDPRKYIDKVTIIPIPQPRPDFRNPQPAEEIEPMDSVEVEE